jgi:prepilin-type processing-associated H-X9-DG protein
VELLVALAIIAILMAILLPAVQQAREAARRTQCSSHLKQIGVALHAYLTSLGSFPPGYVSAVLPDHDDGGPGWGWGASILPYLEQSQLFDRVDFKSPIDALVNEAVRITPVEGFICASDSYFERAVLVPEKKSERIICTVSGASYVGCAGTVRTTCKICRDHFDGVFGRNHAIKPREIQDGLSKTLAAGERSFKWSSATLWGVLPNSKLVDHQVPGKYAAGPAYVLGTTFKEGFNIEEIPLDADEEHTYAESFGSRHPGGCHFLLCDGSVQFIWDSADPAVMNSLSTRAGNPKGKEAIIHDSPF